jgi:hypothetical protein
VSVAVAPGKPPAHRAITSATPTTGLDWSRVHRGGPRSIHRPSARLDYGILGVPHRRVHNDLGWSTRSHDAVRLVIITKRDVTGRSIK